MGWVWGGTLTLSRCYLAGQVGHALAEVIPVGSNLLPQILSQILEKSRHVVANHVVAGGAVVVQTPSGILQCGAGITDIGCFGYIVRLIEDLDRVPQGLSRIAVGQQRVRLGESLLGMPCSDSYLLQCAVYPVQRVTGCSAIGGDRNPGHAAE
jgi:hypothetical protein